MSVQCPICDQPNLVGALECILCGWQLASEAEVQAAVEEVPGLDRATYVEDTRITPDVEPPVAGLEGTLYERVTQAPVERIAVEPTQFLSLDDEADAVPAVDPDLCPFCGTASPDKICDNCGRRKVRYVAPPGAAPERAGRRASDDEKAHCPNCFGRVAWDARCTECGLPLPKRELY